LGRELVDFEAWLRARRLSEGTIAIYASDVRLALATRGGPLARMASTALAPKTLHRTLSALRSWASFRNDADLLAALRHLHLPAAHRVKVKQPLELDVWQRLIEAIRADGEIDTPLRAVLLLMAMRGFRCGDALRLKRVQIVAAVRTGDIVFKAKGSRMLQWNIMSFRDTLEVLLALGPWTDVLSIVAPGTQCPVKAAEKRANGHLRRIGATIGIDGGELHTPAPHGRSGVPARNAGRPRGVAETPGVDGLGQPRDGDGVHGVRETRGARRGRGPHAPEAGTMIFDEWHRAVEVIDATLRDAVRAERDNPSPADKSHLATGRPWSICSPRATISPVPTCAVCSRTGDAAAHRPRRVVSWQCPRRGSTCWSDGSHV
jgi:hypothetical protein